MEYEYTVELTGWAMMRQRRTVKARTAEDAATIALEDYEKHQWEYEGVDDDTVEVSAKTYDDMGPMDSYVIPKIADVQVVTQ